MGTGNGVSPSWNEPRPHTRSCSTSQRLRVLATCLSRSCTRVGEYPGWFDFTEWGKSWAGGSEREEARGRESKKKGHKREREVPELRKHSLTLHLSSSSPLRSSLSTHPFQLPSPAPSLLHQAPLNPPFHSARTYPKFRGRPSARSSLISDPRFLGSCVDWESLKSGTYEPSRREVQDTERSKAEMNLDDVGVVASTFSRVSWDHKDCIKSGERGSQPRSAPLALPALYLRTFAPVALPTLETNHSRGRGRVAYCGQFSRLRLAPAAPQHFIFKDSLTKEGAQVRTHDLIPRADFSQPSFIFPQEDGRDNNQEKSTSRERNKKRSWKRRRKRIGEKKRSVRERVRKHAIALGGQSTTCLEFFQSALPPPAPLIFG